MAAKIISINQPAAVNSIAGNGFSKAYLDELFKQGAEDYMRIRKEHFPLSTLQPVKNIEFKRSINDVVSTASADVKHAGETAIKCCF